MLAAIAGHQQITGDGLKETFGREISRSLPGEEEILDAGLVE